MKIGKYLILLYCFIFFIFIFSLPRVYAKNYYFVEIKGIISYFSYQYISSGIDKADKGDGILVVKLDTPGGLLDATRKIVQLILESETKVVLFVSPQGARAGSAGTFIVLAAHYNAMAEGTNIGAAHPVSITGKDIEGDMRQKIESDTTAFIKSIAEKRGRNSEYAVKMVTESESLTAKEALEAGLIDTIVNTDEELVNIVNEHYGYKDPAKIEYIQPTIIEKIAFFLSDPNVLILLLFIGLLAIYLEFKMPGTFVFAALGISALLLFLMGINIIPINYLALMLILAGIALIIAEVFIPSFGLLTISSIIALSAGMYLFFYKEGNVEIRISKMFIAFTIFFVLGIVLLIGRLLIKDFRKKPVTGMDRLVGKKGRVLIWENGEGKIAVEGEIWNASGSYHLQKDQEVIIENYDGMTLHITTATI